MKYLNLFLSIKRVTTIHRSWHRHCNDIWGLVNEGGNKQCILPSEKQREQTWGEGGSTLSLTSHFNGEHYMTKGIGIVPWTPVCRSLPSLTWAARYHWAMVFLSLAVRWPWAISSLTLAEVTESLRDLEGPPGL